MAPGSYLWPLSFVLLQQSSPVFYTAGRMIHGMFITTSFTQFSKSLILVGSILAVVLANDYMKTENAQRFEFLF